MLLSKIKKLAQSQEFVYFLFYSLCYILVGQLVTCLGPMIPYLAESKGIQETQYSIFFISRALGYILASIFMKWIADRFTLHHYIGLGLILSGIFSIVFIMFDGLYTHTFLIFLASLGIFLIDANVNYAAIQCFKGKNLSIWVQALYGSFGVGGLTGPLVVYLFEMNTLTFLGFYAFGMLVFCYFLQSPQNLSTQNQEKNQEELLLTPPRKSLNMMKLVFLLIVGEQMCYGAWISTFAISQNFSSKQHAVIYSFLFWLFVTVFRFVFALIEGSSMRKIKTLASLGIMSVIGCSFVIFYVHPESGLIGMSALLGICNSSMFPLSFLVLSEVGYKIELAENSSLIMWAYLGEGILPMVVGVLIDIFSSNWFLYSIFLINLSIIGLLTVISNDLRNDRSSKHGQGKLQRLIQKMSTCDDIQLSNQIQMTSMQGRKQIKQ